jgi:hypothetical protein
VRSLRFNSSGFGQNGRRKGRGNKKAAFATFPDYSVTFFSSSAAPSLVLFQPFSAPSLVASQPFSVPSLVLCQAFWESSLTLLPKLSLLPSAACLLFQLQLFTFVLLFVQLLLRIVGVSRSGATVSSVACVVAAKTGEASRTADNAIIVFSSFILN